MDGCFCVLALQQTGEVCGVCHESSQQPHCQSEVDEQKKINGWFDFFLPLLDMTVQSRRIDPSIDSINTNVDIDIGSILDNDDDDSSHKSWQTALPLVMVSAFHNTVIT